MKFSIDNYDSHETCIICMKIEISGYYSKFRGISRFINSLRRSDTYMRR